SIDLATELTSPSRLLNMADEELEVLNRFCKELYESVNQDARLQAERNLQEWSNSSEWLRLSTMLLERGDVPYGPLVASNTLLKLLTNKTSINTEQRLELSRFVLNQLGMRAQSLPPYVVSSLCQLFCRVTKIEWIHMDDGQQFPFKEPIDSIIKSISLENSAESLLALQILSLLISEMNSAVGMESITKHRKTSSTFRDAYLFNIYESTVSHLKEAVVKTNLQPYYPVLMSLLDLNLNCLLFDFIGSLADETSEDNYNVQVPTVWRSAFTDGTVIKLMTQLYIMLPAKFTEKIMGILVQLASIRRTLFNAGERQTYLEELVVGTKMIMDNPSKLSDQGTFHEFCRLVARLKANFQLCELIKVEEYKPMIRLLAEFTVQSLRMVDFSPNSTYYLLCFWHRMVTSVPYIRTQDEHQLEVYCPEIVSAFVESRIAYVEKVVTEGVDDPIDDHGSLLQIFEQIISIIRCDYEKTYRLLIAHFDENAPIYQNGNDNDVSTRIAHGRLVWVVTLMGTAIFGKSTSSNNDEHDKMDGEMLSRVIRLMQLNDSRLEFPSTPNADPGRGSVRMEYAFMHVLENFRRGYIMDQVCRTSAIYEKLQQQLNITDESDILGVIVQKIITNLKFWATNDRILELTLALLKDLSLGYTAVRKLFRLPDIQLLLNNHTSDHFSFLGTGTSLRSMKFRTTFYEALTRLLTTDLNDDDEVFTRFIAPLNQTMQQIVDAFNSNGVDQTQLQCAIIGMCRDVRGIATACTTKALYQILFDWLYPEMFEVMQKAMETWPEKAEVTTPILRFLGELCQNRQQRLKFEMTSCSAVLLFREVSKIIVAYGNRLLALSEVPKDDVYRLRFKNMGICFFILKSCLVGAYVPFGVFRLYGDISLQDSLDMFVKFFLAIPEADFPSYTKISTSYYHLLEAVCTDCMPFVSRLDPQVFAAILRSVQSGVLSIDPTVITSACSSLDLILNFLYKKLTRTLGASSVGMEPDGDGCIMAVKNHPDLLSELLSATMSALMFGEVKCQWSMSRPLLGLILLQEECYTAFKNEILSQQPPEKREHFRMAFESLMDGIERNLTVKNKDAFTQNLAKFRRDIVEIVKGDYVPSSAHNSMV
ncbi:hypothetical protein PENTCL1PPCAC_2229, partial [Pristionchus entomophagus]